MLVFRFYVFETSWINCLESFMLFSIFHNFRRALDDCNRDKNACMSHGEKNGSIIRDLEARYDFTLRIR